jgi:2Fe-2S ferredoxin
MPKITFVAADGERTTVESDADNVMEAAQEHAIAEIDGDCGGVCSCSTCHVRVAEAWVERVAPAEEIEKDTLSFADGVGPRSRLSCQIPLSEKLDGLVVEVG